MKASSGKKPKKSRVRIKEKIRIKLRKLSVRQIRYRQNRLAGMSIYAAARSAGYAQGYSRAHAAIKLERVVKDSIIDELDMAGATNKRQAKEVTRIAFGAMKTEDCRVYRENEDGDIEVEEAGTKVPDDYARLKALDHIARLKKQVSAPFEKTLLGVEYKRLVIVLENDTADKQLDTGRADQIDRTSKLRVETTD